MYISAVNKKEQTMKRLLAIMLLMLASSAQADIYTWKDSRGIVHYTNKEYEIPARYKARAKPLNIEAVQAGGPSTTTTQPGATPQPPAQPQDKPANAQAATANPTPQPVVTPGGGPPVQNVQTQPKRGRRIRTGDE